VLDDLKARGEDLKPADRAAADTADEDAIALHGGVGPTRLVIPVAAMPRLDFCHDRSLWNDPSSGSPEPAKHVTSFARDRAVEGCHDALTVDVAGGRVTTELLAGVARDHQVLLTELRESEANGLEQLFFALTSTNAAADQESTA
jgi:hypothetical protein